MKNFSLAFILALVLITFKSCKTNSEATNYTILSDTISYDKSDISLSISLDKGKSFNHPTYVIWEEDMHGNYLRTIYITRSYASGTFAHKMIGDTMWLKKPGPSNQPAALPYWTHKKGKINSKALIPNPENPFVDAYSGATKNTNFKFITSSSTDKIPYRILVEVNQPWDWNSYWTNNKFPDNHAYKHSAQPSVIYAVTITKDENEFYMNPIGHGDPKGESGNLFTDLRTMSTAVKIFNNIKIELNN